jgi:hypothetical protein
MPNKDESVYGHHSLIAAGIPVAIFPTNQVQDLFALNKEWSHSLRVKPIVPPNDTPPLAHVSYYKLGTSMQDNIHLFVRPPKDAGGCYTIEDAPTKVLAFGRTLEDIGVAWRRIDTEKVIVEKLIRQSYDSSHRVLSLNSVEMFVQQQCPLFRRAFGENSAFSDVATTPTTPT